MSPQMAAEERLRRLAPLAAALVGLAVALVPGLPAPPSAGQVAAALLVAAAAGLVAHGIAAARGGEGVIGGAAAGCWLAAIAVTGGVAADLARSAALALAALVAAVLGRAASREPVLDPPIVAAPAACALAIVEPRAWAIVGVTAGLLAIHERARVRRYLAIPPALAALGAGILTLLAALGRAPTWAPAADAIAPAAWLEGAVDGIGPIALVLAAIGVAALATDRRGRWLLAAAAGALAALVPLSAVPPATALVGLALALGAALAAAIARIGRTRHQVVAAAALAALMLLPFAL